MLKKSTQNARYDRILMKNKNWKPINIKIIGNNKIIKDNYKFFPSDHFELYTEIFYYNNIFSKIYSIIKYILNLFFNILKY